MLKSILYSYPPIATELCLQLPYISRIVLKEVLPSMRTLSNVWNISEIIEKELDKMGINGRRVCDTLRDTPNTFLSGSFLLKCLTSDDWSPSDFDVYSKCVDTVSINSHRYDCNAFTHRLLVKGIIRYDDSGESPSRTVNVVNPQHYRQVYSSKTDAMYKVCTYISRISTFKCVDMDFSFQDILVSRKREVSDVIDDFDMSFLKSTYDGKKLLISNIDDIVKRVCTIEFGEKYFYYILRSSHHGIYDVKACVKILKRIKKYRDRGYTCNIKVLKTPSEFLDMWFEIDTRSNYKNIDKKLYPWYKLIQLAKDVNFDINIHYDELSALLCIPTL